MKFSRNIILKFSFVFFAINLNLTCNCAEIENTYTKNNLRNKSTSYSKEELQKAAELRRVVGEKRLKQEFLDSDDYLIRFLRARDNDLTRATEMLRRAIKWRDENMVNIFKKNFTHISKKCPYKIDRVNVTSVLTIPSWNVRQVMLAGYRKDLALYVAKILEEGEYAVRALNEDSEQHITQGVLIVDLAAFSLQANACLTCLSFYYDFVGIYENYFPLLGRHIFMINTPRSFAEFASTVIKPLFSKHTKEAFKAFGYNSDEYKRELNKIYRADLLGPRYGRNKIIKGN